MKKRAHAVLDALRGHNLPEDRDLILRLREHICRIADAHPAHEHADARELTEWLLEEVSE